MCLPALLMYRFNKLVIIPDQLYCITYCEDNFYFSTFLILSIKGFDNILSTDDTRNHSI